MMAVYGPGVGSMYGTIVDGRRMELETQRNLAPEQISDQISRFAQEIKYMKRKDFNELYELYKDMVHGVTGTRKIKKK